MSLFIVDDEEFFSSLSPRGVRPISQNDFKRKQLFPEVPRKEPAIIEFHNDSFQCRDDSEQGKEVFLPEINLTGRFRGILIVKPQQQPNMLFFRMVLLGPQETILKIENSYQLSQIYRNLTHLQQMYRTASVRVAINASTREIKINLPPLLTCITPSKVQLGEKPEKTQVIFFKKMLRPHIEPINYLIKYLFKDQESLKVRESYETTEKRQLKAIQAYNEISTVSGKIEMTPLEEKNRFSTLAQKRKHMGLKVSLNKQRLDETMVKTFQLFSDSSQYLQKEYNLSEHEMANMKCQLTFPTTETNPFKGPETCSILNYIFVKHNQKWELKKFKEGGFADIYTINLHFWQLSNQFDKPQFYEENLVKKDLIVKREVSFVSDFEMLGNKQSSQKKGRIQHEVEILERLAAAEPVFLPKYYLPTNKILPFPKSIIMDYLPTKTLVQFIESYSITLSLQTKLSYMFSITQSIRYLREFDIVHLDLKPANILMYHKALVKIIDFGESYHPKVCNQDFSPGFTVPYSCPELYSDNKTYTSKSDVFSMGVIFYELLYNRCPFDISVSTSKIDLQMSKYSDLLLCVPEEIQSYGEREVLRQLNLMIFRCLSVNPDERPELDWIALILRQSIELVH